MVDYPIGILREAITLIALKPKGTAPNMWVYLRVFGVTQWAIIWTLLSALVIAMTLMSASNEEKKGDISIKYHVSETIGSAYLFILQQGEHPVERHFGTRSLTMTFAMFALLVFVYYENDITAVVHPQYPSRTLETSFTMTTG